MGSLLIEVSLFFLISWHYSITPLPFWVISPFSPLFVGSLPTPQNPIKADSYSRLLARRVFFWVKNGKVWYEVGNCGKI